MARSSAVAAVLCLFAGFASACGTTSVHARIVRPAAIPIRAFPQIYIAAGHDDIDLLLGDAVVHHLRAGGRAAVRRVDVEDLEPMRAAGTIPRATAVMLIALDTEERTRSEWTSRPETVCGPLGNCYTSHRSYMAELPIIRARLDITVYDGPSARVLQRVTLRASAEGRAYESMRETIVEDLAKRVNPLLDQHVRNVEIDLVDVDVPEVERAIDLIDAGHWRDGRIVLERFAHGPELKQLDREDRAAVLYNLGQARRFDTQTRLATARRFDAAERALRAAYRLHRKGRYGDAIRDLVKHRRDVELVEAQRRAARYNFQLGTRPQTSPQPPASYRQPSR